MVVKKPNNLGIKMLTVQEITDWWPHIEPLFDKATQGNDIIKDELTVQDIYNLAVKGQVAVFLMTEDSQPGCVLAIQFYMMGNKKGADIIAFAGRDVLKFKAAFWDSIIKWLKVNNVKFLDAYVTDRWAKVYQGKFGFNKSCSYVRMNI